MKLDTIGSNAMHGLGATMLLALFVTGAHAQTLTDPNPHSNPATRHSESNGGEALKACPEYGAGFYRVDGTDTCVKIGGFVDAGVSSRR